MKVLCVNGSDVANVTEGVIYSVKDTQVDNGREYYLLDKDDGGSGWAESYRFVVADTNPDNGASIKVVKDCISVQNYLCDGFTIEDAYKIIKYIMDTVGGNEDE